MALKFLYFFRSISAGARRSPSPSATWISARSGCAPSATTTTGSPIRSCFTRRSPARDARALLTELVLAFEGLGLKLEGMTVQKLSLPEEAFAPSHAAGRPIA
jgi:hypothetical protein